MAENAPPITLPFCLGTAGDCEAKHVTKSIKGVASAPFPYGESLSVQTSSVTVGALAYNAKGQDEEALKTLFWLGLPPWGVAPKLPSGLM